MSEEAETWLSKADKLQAQSEALKKLLRSFNSEGNQTGSSAQADGDTLVGEPGADTLKSDEGESIVRTTSREENEGDEDGKAPSGDGDTILESHDTESGKHVPVAEDESSVGVTSGATSVKPKRRRRGGKGKKKKKAGTTAAEESAIGDTATSPSTNDIKFPHLPKLTKELSALTESIKQNFSTLTASTGTADATGSADPTDRITTASQKLQANMAGFKLTRDLEKGAKVLEALTAPLKHGSRLMDDGKIAMRLLTTAFDDSLTPEQKQVGIDFLKSQLSASGAERVEKGQSEYTGSPEEAKRALQMLKDLRKSDVWKSLE